MNQDDYNLASTIISIVSAIIAMVSIAAAVDANRRSRKANKIADEALKINIREHAIQIKPTFEMKLIDIKYFTESQHYDVWMSLFNRGEGTATISSIELYPKLKLIIPESFPCKALTNNPIAIRFQFDWVDFPHYHKPHDDENAIGRSIFWDQSFTIRFTDEFGNKYSSLLTRGSNLDFRGATRAEA
jgi:hypothetical protein